MTGVQGLGKPRGLKRFRVGGHLSFCATPRSGADPAVEKVNMASRIAERINFGKIREVVAPPNLIEIQTNSY
jgi:hypothetical protein